MTEGLRLRPAWPEDAEALAPLAIDAGGGSHAFLLRGGPHEHDIPGFVAEALRRDYGASSFKRCMVAMIDGAIAGCANAYQPREAEKEPTPPEIEATLDPERVAVLRSLLGETPPEDLYVGFLAVAEWARRRGVARALLHQLRAQARTLGAPALSLQHWEDNRPAAALYDAVGFGEVGRKPIEVDGLRAIGAICVYRRLLVD